MKTINKIKFLTLGLMATASALVFTACDGDDDDGGTPAPTASFTYDANGREVAFTSTSKNAKTYAWDFGDGGTSTEANPTHTYEAYGKYTVKLTVTGDGGSATSLPDELTLAKTSDVQIDGDFSDWESIPDAATATEEQGTLTKLKIDYDALKIYLYVEGTEDMKGYFNVYIDADNDSTTGTPSAFNYIYYNMGADFLVDGYIGDVKDAVLFADNPDVAEWCWSADGCPAGSSPTPVLDLGSNLVTASDLKDIGGGKKAIEFTLARNSIPGLENIINLGVTDVDAGGSWATIGSIPVSGTAESRMYQIDMTK